jgi:hypothetical protein
MKSIVFTPTTSEGEIGLSSYILDNQKLTNLCKGFGIAYNIRKINQILNKWKINYPEYVSTKSIVEKYSKTEGTIDPTILTIGVDDSDIDIKLKEVKVILKDIYSVDESDIDIEVKDE